MEPAFMVENRYSYLVGSYRPPTVGGLRGAVAGDRVRAEGPLAVPGGPGPPAARGAHPRANAFRELLALILHTAHPQLPIDPYRFRLELPVDLALVDVLCARSAAMLSALPVVSYELPATMASRTSVLPAPVAEELAAVSGTGVQVTSFQADVSRTLDAAQASAEAGDWKGALTRSLIALLNARLGVWVPNPKCVSRMGVDAAGAVRTGSGPSFRTRYPNRRIGYLLKEFLGVFDPDDLYLYLTDGGHWDNTGLVELLREGMLDEVVCLDADTKASTLRQLADAIVLAKLEIGAEITIDLDELRRTPGTAARGADYARRSVAVGLVRAGGQCGLLWYAKPVLTSKTPADLLAYAETDPSFPSTSTVDQFFHTSRFAAYRDLGRYNARELVAARTALLGAIAASPDLATLRLRGDTHWAVASVLKLVDGEEQYACLRTALAKPPPDRAAAVPVADARTALPTTEHEGGA